MPVYRFRSRRDFFYLSHFKRNSLDAQTKQTKRTASELFLTFTKKCADIRILLRSTYIVLIMSGELTINR